MSFRKRSSITQPAITCSKLTTETLDQRCEICSKLTIKPPKRRQWRRFGGFIVNFEHILHLCSSVSIVNFEQVNARWVCTNRLDGVTNLSKTILLSSLWKIGKVEIDKAFNHHWKQEKVINNVVQINLQRDNYDVHSRSIFQNPVKHLRRSLLRKLLTALVIWRFSARADILTREIVFKSKR